MGEMIISTGNSYSDCNILGNTMFRSQPGSTLFTQRNDFNGGLWSATVNTRITGFSLRYAASGNNVNIRCSIFRML